VPLAELTAASGLGERQLQRRFAEVVGISPRGALAGVIRLRRVFAALREAPLATWSEGRRPPASSTCQMARDFAADPARRRRLAKAGPGSPPASPTPTPERPVANVQAGPVHRLCLPVLLRRIAAMRCGRPHVAPLLLVAGAHAAARRDLVVALGGLGDVSRS
jgi:hypothetical protein